MVDAPGEVGVFVIDAHHEFVKGRRNIHVDCAPGSARRQTIARPLPGKGAPRALTPRRRDAMRAAMRVVFMGAPDFATPALRAILEHGHEVVAVYTRAPQPAGRRGLELTKTPVHRLADEFRPAGGDGGDAAQRRGAGDVPRFRRGRRRRRRLRPHSAAAGAGGAAARLPQPSRVAVAALARRGADPARDHGRRVEVAST